MTLPAPAGADVGVLSPSGERVVLIDRDSATWWIVAGVPHRPELVRSVQLPALGEWDLAAVSDVGPVVASFDGTDALVRVDDGSFTPVLPARGASAVSFLPGRAELLVASHATRSISLVRGLTGTADATRLYDTGASLTDPVGVHADRTGRVYVADRGSRRYRGLLADRADRPRRVSLPADRPRAAGGRRGAFLVTEAGAGVSPWIVDARPERGFAVAVPLTRNARPTP